MPWRRVAEMRLADLSTDEASRWVEEKDPTAVLPTGSTEQHGGHLPLDTDVFLAEQVALAACDGGVDLVLPPIAYGYNEKELTFAGTVSLPADTFWAVLEGIGRSLRRSGWRRLLIVNGHGWNNDLMRAATHRLNEAPGLTVACCCYWDLCRQEVRELRSSAVPGGMAHGGEFETSLMLHLRPAAVRRERIADEISYRRTSHHHHDLFEKSPVFLPEPFELLSAGGVIGEPSKATAEKGQVWFETAVAHLREFLQEFRGLWARPAPDHDPGTEGRPGR